MRLVVYRFFEPIILPLLTAIRPRIVVEVGTGKGLHTRKLLEWAEEASPPCVIHVVDPMPEFPIEELEEHFGDRLVFHRVRSLNALPRLGNADVVLLDGDHNWYTVFHELQILDKATRAAGRPFPATLLHDVDWPYGRRDLYYDPEAIPDAFRQPYKRAGLFPGDSELHEDAGLNRQMANAIYEHNVRSGVRTAAEDFLAENEGRLCFISIPGHHGVGIIVDVQHSKPPAQLGTLLERWESASFLGERLLAIEEDRITTTIELADAQRRIVKLEQAGRELSEVAEAAMARERRLEGAARDRGNKLEALEKVVLERDRERDELLGRIAGADERIQALMASRRRAAEDLRTRSVELRDRAVAQIEGDLELVRRDLERAANSHAWRFGYWLMKALRLLTFRPAKGRGAIERALEHLGQVHLPPPAPSSTPPAERRIAEQSKPEGGPRGASADGPSGASLLVQDGRRDLTADAFTLDERWRDLFSESEREAARTRLAATEGQ